MSPQTSNGPHKGGRTYALGTAAKQFHCRERSAAAPVLTRDIDPHPPTAAGQGRGPI